MRAQNIDTKRLKAIQSETLAIREDYLQRSPSLQKFKNLPALAGAGLVNHALAVASERVATEFALISLPLLDQQRLAALSTKRVSLVEALLLTADEREGPPYPVDDLNLNDYVLNRWHQQSDGVTDLTGDLFLTRQKQALLLAEPIVIWLLQQAKNSVSAQTLLLKATEFLGGDTFSAVALLGEVFAYESRLARIRSRRAVLASKMRPFVDFESQYKTGHNYHFWRILSAALFRGNTTAGRVFGIIDNPIESYQLANRTGFDAADVALASLNAPLNLLRCD